MPYGQWASHWNLAVDGHRYNVTNSALTAGKIPFIIFHFNNRLKRYNDSITNSITGKYFLCNMQQLSLRPRIVVHYSSNNSVDSTRIKSFKKNNPRFFNCSLFVNIKTQERCLTLSSFGWGQEPVWIIILIIFRPFLPTRSNVSPKRSSSHVTNAALNAHSIPSE